jgi:glutamine synthetase adenylyltransferase
VHQEDCLWPAGDVKKRMQCSDVVSSGTRCTMALEPTRQFRQEQASELRVATAELLRHEDRARACDVLRKEADDIRIREGGHTASRR